MEDRGVGVERGHKTNSVLVPAKVMPDLGDFTSTATHS